MHDGAWPMMLRQESRKGTKMVKHIVMWNFKRELSDQQKKEAAARMRELLEPIKELVPGAVEIKVVCNEMESSNREVALISSFASVEALQTYQSHPAHVEAGKYVRSVTCDRACMDYEF